MTTTETIGVTVTYKEPITFYLRMISISEENALRQKMFGLTEEQQAEKSYQNNVDLLADLSEEMPTARRLVTSKEKRAGDKEEREYSEVKDVGLDEYASSPSKAVREFFAERTVTKERIAEYAVRGYFVRLAPDVNFN